MHMEEFPCAEAEGVPIFRECLAWPPPSPHPTTPIPLKLPLGDRGNLQGSTDWGGGGGAVNFVLAEVLTCG